MSTGFQIKEQESAYYLTLQVVGWIDIFTRKFIKTLLLKICIFANKIKVLQFLHM